MQRQQRLLALLADGRFHSGESLGRALGVGRSAVWKLVRALRGGALEVFAVPGRGYRLAEPLELLDPERIRAELDGAARARLGTLEVLPEVDSTNRHLLRRARVGLGAGAACLAECQRAGRGRRGRSWVSPPGANVYLSVLWRFEAAADVTALTLVLGVAAAQALESLGVSGVGIKWPNDLILRERKLGGILLELEGTSGGPLRVVAGVGINVRMPAALASRIEQPWIDLAGAGAAPGRNRLAGRVLARWLDAAERFRREGFVPFRPAWERLDRVRGRAVRVEHPDRTLHGRALGVDHRGALLVCAGDRVHRVQSGEVSLRAAS